MNPDELIFHTVGNELISAGFGINSILLKRGLAPILSFATNDDSSSSSSSSDSDSNESSDDEEKDKSVFRSFKNLAVPFGLMTSDKYKQQPHNEGIEDRGVLPDTLYDNLLKLVSRPTQKIKNHSAKRKVHKRSNNKSARKRNKE
jgi:hypothetical protein